MPVTDVTPDLDSRSLTITAEFAAPVDRVFAIYADPRQMERIWGPPTYPATVVDHDLTPGGRVNYLMTGPDGEKFYGCWLVRTVTAPSGFSFEDAFTDSSFTVNEELPLSRNEYAFAPVEGDAGRTRATYRSTFATVEGLQQVLDMGVVEGATGSINQIDDLLAA
jgi:uncharacterized protein YndB with AHSA1/START domain